MSEHDESIELWSTGDDDEAIHGKGWGPKDPPPPPPDFPRTFDLPVALVTVLRLTNPKFNINNQAAYLLEYSINRNSPLRYGPPPVELPNPVRNELASSFDHRVFVQLWAYYDATEGFPASGSWYGIGAGYPPVHLDLRDGFTQALPMAYENANADGRTGPHFKMYWVPHGPATQFHLAVKVFKFVTPSNYVQTAMMTNPASYHPIGRGPTAALGQRITFDPYGRLNLKGTLPPPPAPPPR